MLIPCLPNSLNIKKRSRVYIGDKVVIVTDPLK